MMDGNGGRTHEPNLREVTAQLDDLRELLALEIKSLRELWAERNQRYEDRFKAQENATALALTSVKEATAVAFTASKEASAKAQMAQDQYNVTHNDLVRKSDTQYANTLPRPEAMAEFRRQDEKLEDLKKETAIKMEDLKKEVAGLRESRSQIAGHAQQEGAGRSQLNWAVGLAVVGGLAALNLLLGLTNFLAR